MTLSREQSRIWQAMNVGVQWILRSSEDPLLSEKEAAHPAQAEQKASKQPTAAPGGTLGSADEIQKLAGLGAAQRTASAPRTSTAPARDRPAFVNEPRSLKPAARPVVPPAVKSEKPAAKAAEPDAALVEAVRSAGWAEISSIISRCHACMMADTRQNVVCADGAPGCPMVLIGEAPGRDEDLQGVPFVGKSGELLNNILAACGLERGKDIAIVNVLKCRPPRNRDPLPEEAAACAAFLDRQLELLAPKVIVLLGRQAMQRMLHRTEKLDALRGRTFSLSIAGREVPVVVTYHPSSLLRNPVDKEKGWHDFLFAKSVLAKALLDQPQAAAATS